MDNDKKLLVIEDEVAILTFLRSTLEQSGWEVFEARTGRIGLDLAASRKPNVILLDLGLPDQDGLDLLKTLRKWTSAPIIIISARGQEKDKITALDSGADDYLTKPFGVPELIARLRVALRHAEQSPEDVPPVYEHQGLHVDLVARRVRLKKKRFIYRPCSMTFWPSWFAARACRASGGADAASLGEHRDASPETLRIFVHQIRHKIEADPVRPRSLKTEPGVGYRLESAED